MTATVKAFSRAASLPARLGGPITARIQARATSRYLSTITDHIAAQQADLLNFHVECLLHMGRGWFHWISAKSYTAPHPIDAAEVLRLLIADQTFRDTYTGDNGHPPVHAIYEIDAISVDSYEPITKDQALTTIDAYCARFEMPQEETGGLQRSVMQPIRNASDIFRIRDLGDTARHEAGWILDDYDEIIALNRQTGSTTMIVMGGD